MSDNRNIFDYECEVYSSLLIKSIPIIIIIMSINIHAIIIYTV